MDQSFVEWFIDDIKKMSPEEMAYFLRAVKFCPQIFIDAITEGLAGCIPAEYARQTGREGLAYLSLVTPRSSCGLFGYVSRKIWLEYKTRNPWGWGSF